ncbi:MAG TPA: PAS domain-containing protein, partial [Ktedonobacterales bacterium]|nr:PAS domain-containing protein [Ktedonobacterales bacterium]
GSASPGSVVVFQDVTELRRLEHVAREQRDLAEGIINSTPFGIVLFDVSDDFRCLRHNAPYLDLTGPDMRARGSAVGATLEEFFDADTGARVRVIFERVRDTGQEVVVEEFPAILPPEPEPRWYKWSLRPLRDARGAITALLGTAIEITEQVRARQQVLAKEAAAQQRASEVETILDTITDGIAVYGPDGNIVRINSAINKLFGYHLAPGFSALSQRERLARLRVTGADGAAMPLDALPQMRALRGETLTGPAAVDLRIATFYGTEIQTSVNAAPLRDGDGVVTGAVVVYRDVSERRELEREATARAAELEGIFEAMTAAVVLFDTDARVTRVNHAARELYARAGGVGAHTLPFADRLLTQVLLDERGEPLPPERWPVSRILRGESVMGADADVWFLTREGERLSMSLNGVPLRDSAGAIVGGIAIYQDVTERRQLEQRTREALDALLEMAQTLVTLPHETAFDVAADADYVEETPPTEVSASAERMIAHRLALLTCGVLGCRRVGITEVAPETELLRAVAVVGLEPEQEKRWWAEQREIERHGMRLGDGADPDELARFRAGEVFTVDMTEPRFRDLPNPYGVTTTLIAPMRAGNRLVGMLSLDYGGPPHVFTPDEMALAGAVAQLGAVALERERLLRERSEAQAAALALTEANRLMDEFLGVASHELRTPLTSMQANVQLIERRMRQVVAAATPSADHGSQPERLPGLVEPITTLIRRTDRQMRRLSRLVNDLLDVSRIHAGKLEFLPEPRDLIAIISEAVEEQRAVWPDREIALESTRRRLIVSVDSDRIDQVITNYLSNALKYSPPESAVAVRVRVRNGAVRVETRDEGPGIAAPEQGRLFERFYRVPGVEQQSGSGIGLGLGLYICKTIIERHGGQVGVESAPGKGSVFWFTLPIEQAADGQSRAASE